MNSQHFYMDEDRFLNPAQKEEITKETQTVINLYKLLKTEDKVNFNRILKEEKYYYI